MRFSGSLVSTLLLAAAGAVQAASSWGFDEGSISVTSKKGPDGIKEKLSQKSPLSKVVTLGSQDTVTISLTAKDNGKAKRPHQAFVLLKDEETGLEAPFPLTVKDDGKAKVQISQKDIPVQLLSTPKPLKATVVLASFGSAQGLLSPVFDIEFNLDPNAAAPAAEKPLRYGKLPEIHHIFRGDPKSPPMVVSFFFTVVVLAPLPLLLGVWFTLGANVDHLSKAVSAAPLSYAAFIGSIFAMEFAFLLYYSTWNLFQLLPAVGILSTIIVFSGKNALGEVQSRRLAGER